MYIEGRTRKKLAKSTVKRAVDKLVKKGMLLAEETTFGTIFTIVDFDKFKCVNGSDDFFCPPFRDTDFEQNDNGTGTEMEQNKRNKEVKKEKNDLNHHRQTGVTNNNASPTLEIRIDAVTTQFIKLRNKGLYLSPKDECAIERICELPAETELLLTWMEDVFREYKIKNPKGIISSAMYCESAIKSRLDEKTSVQETANKSGRR